MFKKFSWEQVGLLGRKYRYKKSVEILFNTEKYGIISRWTLILLRTREMAPLHYTK